MSKRKTISGLPYPENLFAFLDWEFTEEKAARMLEAIDRLPAHHRLALTTRFREGLYFSQCARRLHWSEGTVVARCSKAVDMLQRGPLYEYIISGDQMVTGSKWDDPIEYLDLTTAAYNLLRRNGCRTVRDASDMLKDAEHSCIRWFGERMKERISWALEKHMHPQAAETACNG